MWYLIALIPDHYVLFYFVSTYCKCFCEYSRQTLKMKYTGFKDASPPKQLLYFSNTILRGAKISRTLQEIIETIACNKLLKMLPCDNCCTQPAAVICALFYC